MTAKQAKSKKRTPNLRIVNINENTLYQHCPEILEILLKGRSTSFYNKRKCNIIWANNNYEYLSEHYQATCQITPNLITGDKKGLIVPRALKSKAQQKQRTKNKAEVFTPSWVVKLQNDALDANFINNDLTTYISRIWLEITCREAPYIANRYEISTAKKIAINKRVGFWIENYKELTQKFIINKNGKNSSKKPINLAMVLSGMAILYCWQGRIYWQLIMTIIATNGATNHLMML
ncbi:hypothetical protein [Moraxella sp. ZY200743]|uniref:hypothetical protein n=1 Tax=Moraxella sp. ZY200743 TaxID=2911970 RepID=UPI003D7D0ED4